MDVASATSTAPRPSSSITARGGNAVEKAEDTRTPAQTGTAEPLVNRFPSIAFSYDVDASRLVMLYRDPANGKTVTQIPTEAALKQYKEAQQQEKNAERAAVLEVTVGGSDRKAGGAGRSAGASSSGSEAARAASAGGAHVAHFTSSTPHPAAAAGGTARVNVVI